MIWTLFGYLWLVIPAVLVLVVVLALSFGVWPLVAAAFARLPVRAQMAVVGLLVALVAGSGMYAKGRSDGRDGCAAAQAKAEAKADVKAAGVTEKAAIEAKDASATIRKESSNAATEVRTIIRTVPGVCPPLPARVHDLGRAAVEAARRELPAGEAGGS